MKSTAATTMPVRIENSQFRGLFNPIVPTVSPRISNQNQMNTRNTHFASVETTMTLLCGTGWKMIVLHQIVREWRAHLINELG